MNRHELKNLVMRKCVSVLSIAWPQAAFHWRNGSLFHSVWARVGRGCFVAGLCVLCIWGVWQTMAVGMGNLPEAACSVATMRPNVAAVGALPEHQLASAASS